MRLTNKSQIRSQSKSSRAMAHNASINGTVASIRHKVQGNKKRFVKPELAILAVHEIEMLMLDG